MPAVVALKVADVAPAVTVTEAGTVSVVFVFVSGTLDPPAGAALVSVTVQVVLAFALRLAAAHCREETAGKTVVGATRLMIEVLETPFKVAVMVGFSLAVNALAAAANVALADPTGTVTVAGTVRLAELDFRLTVAPVMALTVTVHELEALGAKVVGAHARLLSVMAGAVTPIVPPVAVTAIGSPAAVEPIAFVRLTVAPLLPDRVTLTVATLPLAIVVAFIPYATQMYPAAPPEHVTDLPAAVRAVPAVTLTLETAAAG
jgi:hypothetical protein